MTDFEQSTEVGELAKAMCAAQKAFKPLTKGSTARVKTRTGGEYTYDYATLPDALEACLPHLTAAGVFVSQGTGGDGETISITTQLTHASGQWMRSTLRLRPNETDPQSVGSAITYGRRYSLLAMVGLAPDEDDDGAAASAPRQSPREAPKSSGRSRSAKPASAPPASSSAPKSFAAKYDCKKGPCDHCGYPVNAGEQAVWGKEKGVLNHARCELQTTDSLPVADEPPPVPDYRDDPDNELPF